MKNFLKIFTAFIVVVVLLSLPGMFYTLPQSQVAVVSSFGAYQYTQDVPGLHMKMPYVQDIHRYSLKIQTSSYRNDKTTSADNIPITTNLYVQYQIPKDDLENLFQNAPREIDYRHVLHQAMLDDWTKVSQHFDSANLIQNQTGVQAAYKKVLGEDLKTALGLDVISVGVTAMSPDPRFAKANLDAYKVNAVGTAKANVNGKMIQSYGKDEKQLEAIGHLEAGKNSHIQAIGGQPLTVVPTQK